MEQSGINNNEKEKEKRGKGGRGLRRETEFILYNNRRSCFIRGFYPIW